ncbi:MAG: response regulator, partial [Desulfobulbaceae bacterium]|nr:response regulator [Desulfobulbaceae bacterium]
DPPLTTGRIMIMDDDDPIREMACKMLDLFGYQVVQARDGNEALALYRKNQVEGAPIDVVIMDLTIPGGMGGKEAIAKLLEFDPQAKVIVASGYANDDVVANYRDYGFVGMISKPFLISDLRAQIAVTLSAEKDS